MNTQVDFTREHAPFMVTEPASDAVAHQLFQRYLGRPADAAALEAIRQQGLTVGAVEAMITRSPEFQKAGRLLADKNRSKFDAAMILIHPAKVLFCPIAKVANTSIKDWALRLDGDCRDRPETAHARLDSGQNKMQAHHLSFAKRDEIAHDPDWAAVAILRDPVDRLISCYCDKFGHNRMRETVLYHTRPVYAFFNNGCDPDAAMIRRGLSFREFCLYINHTKRAVQDSHWIPQWCYLQNQHWDHLFRLDDIATFEEFIRARLPDNLRDSRLGRANVAAKSVAPVRQCLADQRPEDWLSDANPPYRAFLTDDIENFIRQYYALDFQLFNRLQRGGNVSGLN